MLWSGRLHLTGFHPATQTVFLTYQLIGATRQGLHNEICHSCQSSKWLSIACNRHYWWTGPNKFAILPNYVDNPVSRWSKLHYPNYSFADFGTWLYLQYHLVHSRSRFISLTCETIYTLPPSMHRHTPLYSHNQHSVVMMLICFTEEKPNNDKG
jgi:hypothetical protein